MKNDKANFLLKDASAEIKMLRRQNEHLSARLSGFEDALLLLRTPTAYPTQGGMSSPDITYSIDKYLVAEEEERNRNQVSQMP